MVYREYSDLEAKKLIVGVFLSPHEKHVPTALKMLKRDALWQFKRELEELAAYCENEFNVRDERD